MGHENVPFRVSHYASFGIFCSVIFGVKSSLNKEDVVQHATYMFSQQQFCTPSS